MGLREDLGDRENIGSLVANRKSDKLKPGAPEDRKDYSGPEWLQDSDWPWDLNEEAEGITGKREEK
jgi:hypothetical protein